MEKRSYGPSRGSFPIILFCIGLSALTAAMALFGIPAAGLITSRDAVCMNKWMCSYEQILS